jgi:tetratricopeptide (TPR) repeat protein
MNCTAHFRSALGGRMSAAAGHAGLLAVAALFACGSAFAQSKPIDPSVPPPPPAGDSSATQPSTATKPGAAIDPSVPPPPPYDAETEEPAAPEEPKYDPLAAEKNIEVGSFYLKQGNYDAALERFRDAARLHPGYAKPYLMMAEAYERKKDFPEAIKAYQQTLHLYPHDPDRKKIEARIAELQKKAEQERK